VDALERLALEQIMSAGDVAEVLPPRPGWMLDALCRERPTVEFVPVEIKTIAGRDSQAEAVEVCRSCLVRRECGAYALADPMLVGVWGGTTTAERKAARAALDAATPGQRPERAPKRQTRRIVVDDDARWTRSA